MPHGKPHKPKLNRSSGTPTPRTPPKLDRVKGTRTSKSGPTSSANQKKPLSPAQQREAYKREGLGSDGSKMEKDKLYAKLSAKGKEVFENLKDAQAESMSGLLGGTGPVGKGDTVAGTDRYTSPMVRYDSDYENEKIYGL